MTEKVLARGNEVISPPVRTSLMDFIAKSTPQEETTTDETIEGTTDETSQDAETTEGETTDNVEQSSDDTADESVQSDDSQDGEGDADNEQVFEVKGQKVPLKDLLNSYETREEISRRFSEVGKREAKIKADLERAKKEREELDFINEKFEEMHELVLQGNPMAALQIALNMNPKDSTQPKAMKELIDQAIAIAENFQSMTEEEQRIFLDKEELSVKERNLARKEKKQKEKEEAEELDRYYQTALNTNGVTDEEVEKAVDTINSLPQFKEVLAKKEYKERIDYCVTWVLGQRLSNTITQGIEKIDPVLAKDNDFRLALLELVDPKSTVDDVAQIVKEFKRSTSSSVQSNSGASTKSVAPKKTTTSNRAPTEKPKAENNKPILSWDDLVAKHSQ